MVLEREAKQRFYENASEGDLKWGAIYLRDVDRGVVPRWWADSLCQKHHALTLPDAMVMFAFEKRLAAGWLGVGRIHVGNRPKADSEREGNQDLLSSAQIEAMVYLDQQHGPDGQIAVPRLAYTCLGPSAGEPFGLPLAGAIPLEIGSCAASTTLFRHLHGLVARWPYGHNWIYLLVVSGPHHIHLALENIEPPAPRPWKVWPSSDLETQLRWDE